MTDLLNGVAALDGASAAAAAAARDGGGDRKDREDCSSVDSELGEHCGRDDGVKERKCWGVVCEDAFETETTVGSGIR